MTVKALKKQLMAAIAMVVVSAIALSSSTYAWFASNTKVTASMTSITATSDAAFLEITTDSNAWNNLTSVEITSTPSPLNLLPARVKSISEGTPTFETAHALAPTAATINAETLKDIMAEDADNTDFDKYVWHTTVYVRAQSGSYTNLTMDNLSISATGPEIGLEDAGRVLAICGSNYQLRSKSGTETLAGSSTYLYTGTLTGETYATVELYFYYDGDTSTVYTNNIDHLGAIQATVGFQATQN